MKIFLKSLLIVLVLCFKYGESIRCFECSSWNNSMCLEPLSYDQETLQNYLHLVECGEGVYPVKREQFFCRKIVQTVMRKGYYPEARVARGCGWVRSERECYKADNEDHLETVCQCFSDGCNGGAAVESNMLALITALSALGLRYFKF